MGVGIEGTMGIQPFRSTLRDSVRGPTGKRRTVRHNIGFVAEIVLQTKSVPEFMGSCVNIKTRTGGGDESISTMVTADPYPAYLPASCANFFSTNIQHCEIDILRVVKLFTDFCPDDV